ATVGRRINGDGARILRPLLWFGLLEYRHDAPPGDRYDEGCFYRKSALFDRFLEVRCRDRPRIVDAELRPSGPALMLPADLPAGAAQWSSHGRTARPRALFARRSQAFRLDLA